jgi:hypothetical protein
MHKRQEGALRVELTRTLSGDDVGQQRCAICERAFILGAATAWALSESGLALGKVCPSCLESGPEGICARLARRAAWSRRIAEQDAGFVEEGWVGECPTPEELEMLGKLFRTPLYATMEQANEVPEHGGRGLLEPKDYE